MNYSLAPTIANVLNTMTKETYRYLKVAGLITTLLAVSCQHNPYPGIPSGSVLQDKAYGTTLFLHVDDSTCDPNKATVWAYNNKTQEARSIVSSTGEAMGVWFKSDTIKSYWPKDCIADIYSAKIVSWPGEPLRIVVDGCPDQRNIWSYIVTESSDTAILLPTNAGFLGIAEEEDLMIALSYDYYDAGGRYDVIKVFDNEGDIIRTIPLNTRPDTPLE